MSTLFNWSPHVVTIQNLQVKPWARAATGALGYSPESFANTMFGSRLVSASTAAPGRLASRRTHVRRARARQPVQRRRARHGDQRSNSHSARAEQLEVREQSGLVACPGEDSRVELYRQIIARDSPPALSATRGSALLRRLVRGSSRLHHASRPPTPLSHPILSHLAPTIRVVRPACVSILLTIQVAVATGSTFGLGFRSTYTTPATR
jgi:hypothetical protein